MQSTTNLSVPMRPALRAISAASASSSVSLPSSDGWNWKNGNWIQRRDPRVEKPSAKTAATSAIVPM